MDSQFNVELFQKKLSTQWLGRSICYFNELESTNTYVKKMPADDVEHGMICLTDNQTRGRGQYERKWESENSKNLTFSLVLLPPTSERFHVLTLASALALVEYLDAVMHRQHCAHIKWPNDVLLNDKKVAGFLAETVFTGNKLDRLVIGIGLNVNQENFSPELSGKATSVCLERGESMNRETMLCDLLGRIEYKYRLWSRRKSDLLKSINRNIEGYGQWIRVIVNDKMLDDTYKLLGIDESGKLLMLNQDAGIESFSYEQIRLVVD